MTEDILKRLVKIGQFSDWLGLVSGYKLQKVADQIIFFGLTGTEFWPKAALETVLAPYRKHALQQKITKKTIDEDLRYFASKAKVDLNRVRRVYYQINIEPSEKPEELIEEAEDELPEFEEETEGEAEE